MKSVFTRQNATRATAALLCAWLSGLVLLFCCVNIPRALAAEMTDSCPLSKPKHCDSAKDLAKANESAAIQKESLAFGCCGFLPKLFDKGRFIEKNPLPLLTAKLEKPAAPKFFFAAQTAENPPTYQSIIRNRGNTYLRNCVFRI